MAITVGGTTITFNDGTTQSTAGGAPTTAQVLNATAGASVGAVGTYALLKATSYTQGVIQPGGTAAGSGLSYYDVRNGAQSGTASGTWRCMGLSNSYTQWVCCQGQVYYTGATLWLRIS
jgi:hypothetical protein